VMGPVLGPIIGGFLTENWDWRWVFFVNLPIGLVALAILLAQLPKRPLVKRKFDLTGFALIGIALTSLQLMLDRGHRLDWFDSLEIWIWCGMAISAAWMGLVHLATGKNPLFDRALFRDFNLLTGLFFIFIAGTILFSSMALLPTLLQDILGYGVVETGLMLAMRGIGVMLSMQVAGLLMRFGADTRMLIGTGFGITGLSLYMMSRWSLDIQPWDIAMPGLVQGLGIGLVFIPLNTSAFATLAPHLRTDASSLMNLFRNIGSSLGIAVLTALLASNMQVAHADIGSSLTAVSSGLSDLTALDRYQDLGGAALSMANNEVTRQAAMIAYIDDFYAMMWLTFCTMPLVLFIRRPPKQLMGR
ncbi:MAG: MFS transporter, partial [Proteobacteria bacterium]